MIFPSLLHDMPPWTWYDQYRSTWPYRLWKSYRMELVKKPVIWIKLSHKTLLYNLWLSLLAELIQENYTGDVEWLESALLTPPPSVPAGTPTRQFHNSLRLSEQEVVWVQLFLRKIRWVQPLSLKTRSISLLSLLVPQNQNLQKNKMSQ